MVNLFYNYSARPRHNSSIFVFEYLNFCDISLVLSHYIYFQTLESTESIISENALPKHPFIIVKGKLQFVTNCV